MPSVLILDNLHMLCPAESPAPEQAAANSGVAALVQWLCEVLDYFARQSDGRPPLPGDQPTSRVHPYPASAGAQYVGLGDKTCGH